MLYTFSNKKSVQYVLAALKQQGISQVVLSPGSRNAPLLISFPKDDFFELYSIVDERSAAFFALGLALCSGKAVALSCTSGSAMLNYAPALAEAFYQQVPLVVLSADRPENLIDKGYGQCIHQKEALQSVVKAYCHFNESAFDKPAEAEKSVQQLQQLLQEATQGVPGPVHINMAFSEPLYDIEERSYPALPELLPMPKPKNEEALAAFAKAFGHAKKKLVLVGQLPLSQNCTALLHALALRKDTFVMSETLANVGANFPACIDPLLALMRTEDESSYAPDMVISIGGHIVSKHVKKWLSALSFSHWQLGEGQHKRDTFFQGVNVVTASFDTLLSLVQKELLNAHEGTFASLWTDARLKLQRYHSSFVASVPFSDFKVYAIISAFMQQQIDAYDLHMANSTAIRYAQLFTWGNPDQQHMYSNRGVSGLEGSLSTALGASQQSERISCCFMGDLAFFYDANALWNKYMHARFKIIVVHNGGGGIFRFIDGPADSQQLSLFETPHQRTAKSLALEAGMHYFYAANEAHLSAQLPQFFQATDKACLLEIHTPQTDNAEVLKSYFSGLDS